MKIRPADAKVAIDKLSMCRFFPPDEGTRAAIETFLVRICPSKEALDWLCDQFSNVIGEWKGPVELRAVLCTRFPPADGIEATSSIPGFRPCDGEARALEQHAQLTAGGWTDETEQARSRELPMAPESRKLIETIRKDWPQ